MKEKLIIKNFGPIKDVELELGRFNVLIGEQATGKSTVAKVLIAINNTCFRELFDLQEDESQNRDTQLFKEHLKLVGIENYLYRETEIYFTSVDFVFEFSAEDVRLKRNDIFNLAKRLKYDFTYIPSERNLVITLADSLFALMQTGTSLPKLFLRFGDKFQKARKEKEKFDFRKIIGVNYIHRDNGDIVQLQSGKEISIDDSSSGIQSSIPLLTVFDYVIKTSGNDNLLVIEEPELNCFPNTQYKLVNHFVESNFSNHKTQNDQYRNKLLITTHSPYTLTSLNNLMYAYRVGQTHKEEANKIIEEKYWINPDDVSAYQLLSDGTCEDILDRNESMIEADKIDEVSRTINKEFDELMNIEFVTQ